MTPSGLHLIAAFSALVIGGGFVSVAFAATMPVTTTGLTTSSVGVTIAPTTCTLYPVADAMVDRNATTTNFGSATTLAVRKQAGNRMKRSLLRFDIASCSIPAGAQVLSSTLQLRVITAPGTNVTYGVHRVTESWAEGTVTYTNQPTLVAGATSSIATGTSPTSLSWSVLSDVAAFVQGSATNEGWVIKDANEGNNPAVETVFGSLQNGTVANRPTLVIGYYP